MSALLNPSIEKIPEDHELEARKIWAVEKDSTSAK